jgi:hypothetical protein
MFQKLTCLVVTVLTPQAMAADHYYTINTTTPNGNDILVRIDVDQPEVAIVGELGIDTLLTGMAFSPVAVQGPDGETYPAGTLWAYDGQGGDLFTLDLEPGAANLLGQVPGGGVTDYALSFDLEGNLYTAFGSSVRRIDTESLTTTPVGTLPFSDLDEWDVLEVAQEIPGVGMVPAGMFIANVGGNAADNLWLVDPSDWSGTDLGELGSTSLNWSVATGGSGAIYGSGSPANHRTVNRIFLDPLSAELIVNSGQPSIYGADVIAVPANECPEDLDGSGVVDVEDLTTLLAAWNESGGPEDLDGDGVVGTSDLLLLIAAWGPC